MAELRADAGKDALAPSRLEDGVRSRGSSKVMGRDVEAMDSERLDETAC